jgi:hypothetical protein
VLAIVPSSNANALKYSETEIDFHPTEKDDNGRVFCTERPRQRAKHGASNDEHTFMVGSTVGTACNAYP